MQITTFLLTGLLGIMSIPALGHDFSEADRLFAERAQSRANVTTSKGLYTEALGQVTGDEAVYAVERIMRLAVYEGKQYAANDNERKDIYAACMNAADKINPSILGKQHPAYWYAKAACLSLWAKANGILSSLRRSKELFEYLDAGIALDPTYEGGGFYRIKGAALEKLPAINPFGPTKDLPKSRELLEAAIDSPAYSGATNPATETGEYFYDNFMYYAETLHASGDTAEALNVIQGALDRINAGEVPTDRRSETETSKRELIKLQDSLQ